MAVITESVQPMDNTVDNLRMEFMILPTTDDRVAAVASDPENPTIGERLFVRLLVWVTRSDTGSGEFRSSEWTHVSDSEIATFTAGDSAALRPLLKDIRDQLVSDMGV